MHYKLGMIARSSDEIAGLMEKYSEYKEVEPYIYKTKDELIKIGKKNVEAFLGYLKENELTLAGLDDYLSDEKNKSKGHNYYLLNFYKELYVRLGVYDRLLKLSDNDYYRIALEGHYNYQDPDCDYKLDKDGNLLTTYNRDAQFDYYSEYYGYFNGKYGDNVRVKKFLKDFVNNENAETEEDVLYMPYALSDGDVWLCREDFNSDEEYGKECVNLLKKYEDGLYFVFFLDCHV